MKSLIKEFYSSNFVYNGKEKLSKLTIMFIALLNICIYLTLGLGIDFQIKVLNSPSVVFPYECSEIVNSNNVDDFGQYYYKSNNNNSNYQEIKNLEIDNRCYTIVKIKLEEIKKEHKIKELVTLSNRLSNSQNKINNELTYIRENYNTILFEKISSHPTDKSIVKNELSTENIKEKYNAYQIEYEKIKKEKEELERNFSESKSVKDLISYISLNKEQINNDINSLEKSYSLKKELVTLAFLLPLIITFFYLMKRYLIKEKYVLYILFKNMLIVTFIPTIISIIYLVYKLLPKIFIEKLLKFFYMLEIPFIVYYFAIAIFIFIFALLIIKLQKRFKEENNSLINNSITKVESYNKNTCNKCGNRVDFKTMNYCPCCQNKLKTECKSCYKITLKDLDYCFNCGNSLKE